MAIQFEKKFFRYPDEVSSYVKEMLECGGSWDFKVAFVPEKDDKPSGYFVTANPIVTEWQVVSYNDGNCADGYECYIPEGSINETVIGWEEKKEADKLKEEIMTMASKMDISGWSMDMENEMVRMTAEFISRIPGRRE